MVEWAEGLNVGFANVSSVGLYVGRDVDTCKGSSEAGIAGGLDFGFADGFNVSLYVERDVGTWEDRRGGSAVGLL